MTSTTRALVASAMLALLSAAAVGAQATPPAQTAVRRDTAAVPRAPITPRRAFLYSLVAPGSAQSILGRHKAAAGMLTMEAISVIMIRESAADVRQAKRASIDTMIVSYVDDRGGPRGTPERAPGRFTGTDVRARKAHVEDWIAVLIGNHLFSSADAFVAANLWDVPIRLGVRSAPAGGTVVAARIAW